MFVTPKAQNLDFDEGVSFIEKFVSEKVSCARSGCHSLEYTGIWWKMYLHAHPIISNRVFFYSCNLASPWYSSAEVRRFVSTLFSRSGREAHRCAWRSDAERGTIWATNGMS